MIVRLRDAHLSALEGLAQGWKLAQSKRDACAPEEIAPAAGKFQTVAMKQLMNQLGMGGSNWLANSPMDPRLPASCLENICSHLSPA